MKRKICAVTANRADFSRIETMLRAVKAHPDLELQLVVMGSHLLEVTGKTITEIEKKGYVADRTIYMEVAGNIPTTMAKSVGLAIVELTSVFDQLKPDIVLVPVDRFESMAMGVAAALMNIHVAHTQGGEVTGTIDESIRHALTKLSHLHFVASQQSRERVIKMGENPEYVFNVGCPATDLLLESDVLSASESLTVLNETVIKTKDKFDPSRPYILVLQHPVTTEFANIENQIGETMEALREFANHQIIMLWPNIDAGSDDISRLIRKYLNTTELNTPNVKIVKHIPSDLFVNLLRNAECLIGNSSSGIREACYTGTPVVNIGSRQSMRERGHNVVDAPYNRTDIALAIRNQIAHGKYEPEYIYGTGDAGKRFADICATIELGNVQKRITY
jgi:UDP-hydrolysing UDP-N-acetyl-D-glucosamine 2-epimerase